MRKIVVSMYATLDGVIDSMEKWHFKSWNDELAAFARQQLFAADALLMGRVTYEIFAATWPTITDDVGFADRMNSIPKYIVSSTLDEPEWNNSTVVAGDVAAAVTELKQQPGQDILVYGGARIVRTLFALGLVDDLHIWVHPVVLGGGTTLFGEGLSPTELTLADTTTFRSGVVVLSYQVTPAPPA
jgi:dihydrofolate reductase